MTLRLRERISSQQRPDLGQGRRFARVILLAAILVLAWVQGYSFRGWILVGIAVLWAAALPFLLRGFSRRLQGAENLTPGQRRVILVAAAVLLLAGFAAGVLLLLP